MGDLGALLRTPRISPEDVRWVARTAQARGDRALAEEALLELVRLGKASAQEQQQLRRLADAAAVASAQRGDATRPSAEPGREGEVELLIWRDTADGPLHARLTGGPDGTPAGAEIDSVWRREWEDLPRSLADQLAVCALVRAAHLGGAQTVRSTDPWTGPLAAEVASTRAGRAPVPAQEQNP